MKNYKCDKCKKIYHYPAHGFQIGVKGKYTPIYLCFDCYAKREEQKIED